MMVNNIALHQFPFYKDLSKGAKALLTSNAMEVTMPSCMELFVQGDQCHNILFLTEGLVRVYRIHESGQEITLYYLEPLEQCNVNLNSAFTNTPAVGTAVSESEIKGFMVSSQTIKALYTSEISYQQYVFDLFASRMEGMAELVEDVRFKKMDERLLSWLQSENSSIITITHEKLASHLGTSREVISRLLKELEHQKIVKLSRGYIELLLVQSKLH
jgi:CRP/FNR family transcriptional regulator